MTTKQCRTCVHLRFHRDYYMHVDCESKELFYDKERPRDAFDLSLLENEECRFYEAMDV